MFGSAQHQWPESARKRAREDDDVDTMNGPLSFTEHRNKRLHSLPLRASPAHKRWSHPPSFPSTCVQPATITPADSDSEDNQQPVSHFSPWSSSPAFSQQMQTSPSPGMDIDRDTDMMVTEESNRLYPGPSQPDPIAPSITGRMPTPIHCTFAAQVRGNSWGTANKIVNAIDGFSNSMNTGFSQARSFHDQDPSVPRSLEGVPEWSMVQNRRLPSPISESGGEENPPSPGMVLDSSSAHNLQRPPLPHNPHSTNPMTHPNILVPRSSVDADMGMMDTDAPSSQPQDANSPSSAPATPSPRGKFGHIRSKHTLNSWTQQAGMKKSFSIGYRADCEKCQQRIPGHFNHIIIS